MSKNYILSPSETIHYKHEGELLFDAILSPSELEKLLAAIEAAEGSRDLFLRSEQLRKFYSNSLLRAIVTGLFPKRQIRIGFDMLLSPNTGTPLPLRDLTSILGVEAGVVIDLANGDVTVLSPEKAVPEAESKRLLIGFANEIAIYRLNERDPDTHTLKRLGYAFGDKLTPRTHPFIQRI